MKFKNNIFLILAIFLVFALFIGGVFGEDVVGSNETRSANDPAEFDVIQNAISSANPGETIYLNNTYYKGSSQISISKSLTLDGSIQGEGGMSTIDGDGISGLFSIQKGISVTFVNINFTNGNAAQGGAIFNNYAESSINVVNSVFYNNKATVNGGGIYSNGGFVTISNSNFTKNTALFNGGCIYCSGSTNIIKSNFNMNTAYCGGVIYSSSVFSITNSVFVNNFNVERGAAIYNRGEGNIFDSLFINCSAREGGVVFNYGNVNFDKSSFINCSADYGGVFSGMGSFNLTNSFLTNNTAITGGIIRTLDVTSINVINSVFNNNTGCIVQNLEGSTIRIGNSSFVNGSSDDEALIFNVGNMDISNSNFTNNDILHDLVIIQNIGLSNITGSIFKNAYNNNSAILSEGSIYLSNNTLEQFKIPIIINGGTVTSPTYLTFANVSVVLGEETILFANLTDDNQNTLYSPNNVYVNFNGSNYEMVYDNGTYQYNFTPQNIGFNTISGNYALATNLIVSKSQLAVKRNCTIDATINNNTYGNANGIVTLPGDATGNITIKVNGTDLETFDVRGSSTIWKLDKLPVGKHNITFVYNGNNQYWSAEISKSIDVVKADVDLTKADIIIDGENVTVIVDLGSDTKGNITLTIKNRTVTLPLDNGTVRYAFGDVGQGEYELNITYSGDDNHNSASQSIPFFIKQNPDLAIEVDGRKVQVILSEDATGRITLLFDGETLDKGYLKNGVVIFDLPDIGGWHNLTAVYAGDDYYNARSKTIEIFVKYTPELNINLNDNRLTISLPANATGSIEILIDGKKIDNKNLTDGKAGFNLSDLEIGPHSLTAIYSGDDYYNSVENFTNFYFKQNPKIDVGINGESIRVLLPEDAKGNVTITIDGRKIKVEDLVNGSATIDLPILGEGAHNLTVTYSGDDKYLNNTYKTIFEIKGYVLSAEDVTIYYRNGTRFVCCLTDLRGVPVVNKDIVISVNGVSYIKTTNNYGFASLAINLDAGSYVITAVFNEGNVSTINRVIVLTTVIGKDITKYFANDTQYEVKIVDGQGKPLVGVDVLLNIHGVFYTRTTNDKGIATLKINLHQGTFIITAKNPYNGELQSNTITVKSILYGNNLTVYYRNGSQYLVELVDGQGKPLVGEIVTFNINGVFYNRTTNGAGVAALSINLRPSEYVVTAMYKNAVISNRIKVLPIILSDNLIMTYEEKMPFNVILLDGKGNPAPNREVSFNIQGKIYSKVSDINGLASLDIDLMPGKYIITSSYNGLSISDSITIT